MKGQGVCTRLNIRERACRRHVNGLQHWQAGLTVYKLAIVVVLVGPGDDLRRCSPNRSGQPPATLLAGAFNQCRHSSALHLGAILIKPG